MIRTLDPEVQRLLELAAQLQLPDVNTLPVAEARAQFLAARPALAGEMTAVHSVCDATVPGPAGPIPIRSYRSGGANDPLPTLVYFHGGGWVIGNLDSHDDVCRALCAHSGCAVISVDYRLAPEHPFPAAVDDALAATRWIAEHAAEFGVEPARLAVGGDSAGGNLAAAVTLLARSGGPALRFQLLIYPAIDMTLASASVREFAEGYRLTRAAMQWFVGHYLGADADRRDPLASPLFAADLRGLPPAYIITAGFDPLVDEGRAYADKLRGAGVAVEYRCYDGMIHGFFGMAGALTKADEAQREAALALKRALRS